MRINRERPRETRPVLLAIAGDSGAGKTTLTAGLVQALGPDRCVSLCTDDYHRYERDERRSLPFTALHPDCNHVDIMEQHLQLLAMGQPVLKPVYDHATGLLSRPRKVEPNEFVIVEGLLPLHTKLTRACFDVTVFLDPDEDVRRGWKVARDTRERGYSTEQVLAELDRRAPDAEAYVRAQRQHADIVVRFAPIATRDDLPGTPLSAELMLRPTIRHADISGALASGLSSAVHLRLTRDTDGRPIDALHVHGYAPRAECLAVEKAIWASIGEPGSAPSCLGELGQGVRSEPLAITQLLLLHHLREAVR